MSTIAKRILLALFVAGIFSGSNVFAKTIKEYGRDKPKKQFGVLIMIVKGERYFPNRAKVHLIKKTDPETLRMKDENGNTPLHWAVTRGDKEFVEAMVKKPGMGDLIMIRNNIGKTPFDIARFKTSAFDKTKANEEIFNFLNEYYYGK